MEFNSKIVSRSGVLLLTSIGVFIVNLHHVILTPFMATLNSKTHNKMFCEHAPPHTAEKKETLKQFL